MVAHALQLLADKVADALVALDEISPRENGRYELFVDPPPDKLSKFYDAYCVRMQGMQALEHTSQLIPSYKRSGDSLALLLTRVVGPACFPFRVHVQLDATQMFAQKPFSLGFARSTSVPTIKTSRLECSKYAHAPCIRFQRESSFPTFVEDIIDQGHKRTEH